MLIDIADAIINPYMSTIFLSRNSLKVDLTYLNENSSPSSLGSISTGISKVGIGDLMSPETLMTTISNVDPINVDFSISEQDYMRFVREKTGRAAGRSLQLILRDGTLYAQGSHAVMLKREVD